MTRLGLVLLLGLGLGSPAAVEAQQRGGSDDARRAAVQARRDSLEAEVVQRFLARLTRDLQLDAAQRAETERVLKRSSERRRALTREAGELRSRLHRALRSESTTDVEFQRLLADHETLRTREHDLWRQDQAELAAVLRPRQRVQFIVTWAHFQDTMREIMSQRPGDRQRPLPQ
jgi:chromosome segregation ATPase